MATYFLDDIGTYFSTLLATFIDLNSEVSGKTKPYVPTIYSDLSNKIKHTYSL